MKWRRLRKIRYVYLKKVARIVLPSMKLEGDSMKTEYVTLLTVAVSLLSGWGGAFIAGYFSRKSSIDAMDKEYQLSLEKRNETERRELLNLYVSIIKSDFERSPITLYPNGLLSLDQRFYDDEIRPKIYEKYYLIHENVIIHFNQIEKRNAEINANDGYDDRKPVIKQRIQELRTSC
jgi:hypothetical protein